jgi:hypothetical protein
MSNVPKVLIGAAIGVVNLVILLLIWRWWSRRTGPSVDTSKFTPRGEAAEQAAFKGDGAYSYGEFAGGSDSKADGRHANEVSPGYTSQRGLGGVSQLAGTAQPGLTVGAQPQCPEPDE